MASDDARAASSDDARSERRALGPTSHLSDSGRIPASPEFIESERRMRELLENVQVIAMTLNTRAELTFCNPFLLHLTGWTADEILGRSWFEYFVPAEERARVRAVFDEGMLSGKMALHYQNPILTKSGSTRTIAWDNTMLRDSGGHVVGCVSLGRDITDQLLLEEQYRHAQKLESIGRLAGAVAHDFNNLLTVINGYSAMVLRDLTPDDPLTERIDEIRKAGHRAASLTRQLLTLSRKQMVRPSPVPLNRVIGDMASMLRRLIGENIELVTDLEPAMPDVFADEGQLEQVIMNLVVNARDAMPNGGRLTIRTAACEQPGSRSLRFGLSQEGPHPVLEIADSGTGISDSVKEHLFEPFFTTKEKGIGTGLGLATVYGIVTQAAGHIAVDSAPGKGTRFRIFLPAHAETPGAESADAKLASPGLAAGETVLLVEDHESVRRFAAGVLAGAGYRVLQAGSAEEGLAEAEKIGYAIDLLVTDVVLPKRSGRELAVELARRSPSIKVLFLSGYTDDILGTHGILDPGLCFLAKPFASDALLSAVRAALTKA